RHGSEQQGVAVGIGRCHGARAGGAACPCPVLDDHALPERILHDLRRQPRRQIGRSAWAERHDELDRLRWVALRAGTIGAAYREHGAHYQTHNSSHSILIPVSLAMRVQRARSAASRALAAAGVEVIGSAPALRVASITFGSLPAATTTSC